MAKPPSTLLPIFGSAVAVSIMMLLYYEKRRNVTGENEARDKEKEGANTDQSVQTDHDIEQETVDETENEIDVLVDVTACSSKTSYTSFDDEELKSCQSASSSTSAYSTASDDSGPFPVGEYSTYKQQQTTKDLNSLDLNEILNSPVVENHCMDERMRRSPTKPGATLEQFYTDIDSSRACEMESTNLESIVVAYNDIVPPLRPNTGELIRPSNTTKTRKNDL